MIDYKRNDFWIKIDDKSDNKLYYIRLNGLYIKVTKDVYDVCYYSYRKDLRDSRKIQMNNISLDYKNGNGHNLVDIIGLPDETIKNITNTFLVDRIEKVLNELEEVDKEIASLSLFKGKSETEIAEILGLTKSTVNYRKSKIFKKLRYELKNINTWI